MNPLARIHIVKDLLTVFVEDYGTSHWSMSTYEYKKGLLENYIIPTIGNVPISELTPLKMDRYINSLSNVRAIRSKFHNPASEFISEYTIHEIWKFLSLAFEQAVRWGFIEKKSCDSHQEDMEKKEHPRYMDS